MHQRFMPFLTYHLPGFGTAERSATNANLPSFFINDTDYIVFLKTSFDSSYSNEQYADCLRSA